LRSHSVRHHPSGSLQMVNDMKWRRQMLNHPDSCSPVSFLILSQYTSKVEGRWQFGMSHLKSLGCRGVFTRVFHLPLSWLLELSGCMGSCIWSSVVLAKLRSCVVFGIWGRAMCFCLLFCCGSYLVFASSLCFSSSYSSFIFSLVNY